MSHFAPLPFAIMLAALAAIPAHAGSGSPASLDTGLSSLSSAEAMDIPDEPSSVIATGDFNRDGIADMVEAISPDGKESSRHVLTVLLGQADGTFKSGASHNLTGSAPRALVVADFNRDRNPDVIVGNEDGGLVEFLGDGKGNLVGAGNIASAGSVISIATGQFTHDGNLDIVVSDPRSNSAVIFLGAGDGSFRPAWSFALPRIGSEFHVATADFNKDGIADLVITSPDNDDYEVMLGTGNGTFTYAPELSHVRDPNSYCPS